MGFTMGQLPKLTGRFVILTMDRPGQDDPIEVRGKLVGVSGDYKSLVIQIGSKVEMLEVQFLLDVDIDERLGKVTLRTPTLLTVRQHMLDRHGQSFRNMLAMSAEDALVRHARTSHADTGHVHQDPVNEPKERELTRLTLGGIDIYEMKYHLVQWHALPFSLVRGLEPGAAFEVHGRIIHDDTGHQHTPHVPTPREGKNP